MDIVRQMVLLSNMVRMPRLMLRKMSIGVQMGLESSGMNWVCQWKIQLNLKIFLVGPLSSCSTTHPQVHENLTCMATLVYVTPFQSFSLLLSLQDIQVTTQLYRFGSHNYSHNMMLQKTRIQT